MLPLILSHLLTATAAVAPAVPLNHICWIDRVVVDGPGVRIVFTEQALVRPADKNIHLEPGDEFWVGNSGHDGCSIKVTRKRGRLGVKAEASFFDRSRMKKPSVTSDWIVASEGK